MKKRATYKGIYTPNNPSKYAGDPKRIKTKNGKRFMIEIKPAAQTKQPKPKTKKSRAFMRESLEYIKNIAKWQAADVYCNDNNMEFKIFTEKELGIY